MWDMEWSVAVTCLYYVWAQELQDWYKHLTQQRDKRGEVNKEHQKAFIAQRDESAPGAEWERVCRLCVFNTMAKGTTKDFKDTSRYRSLLLNLKQTPPIR
jgi:clathrin light chain A